MTTSKKPLFFSEIKVEKINSIKTGNEKFDKWFSRPGGIVNKSAIFVTGTSGAGKTTLMFNLMKWLYKYKFAFYERETTLDEVKSQVYPLTIDHNNALLMDYNTHPHFNDFMEFLEIEKPKFICIDSIQSIAQEDFPEMGEEKAIQLIRIKLMRFAKQNNSILFVIGHNTKEGEFAGKNANMQMFDAHMVLEYDMETGIRKIFWGRKNRKGPMGIMYYEIQDGKIIFFNKNEYKLPEIESVDLKDAPYNKLLSNFVKGILKQYSKKPNYDKFLNDYNNSLKNMIGFTKGNEQKIMVESVKIIDILTKRYGY